MPEQSPGAQISSMSQNAHRLPGWLVVAVILGALLMAAGAVIALKNPAMLVSPHVEMNEGVQVYAGYLVSRNLALAAMLIAALWMRSRTALCTLMLLTAVIQLLDAGMDAMEGRWAIVPGVLVFGIVFLMGAGLLRKRRI